MAVFTGFYQSAKDYIQIIISAFALSIPFYMSIDESSDEKEILLIGVVYFIIYFLTATASRNTNKLNALFKSTGIYLNVLLLAGIAMGLAAGILYNFLFFSLSLVFFVLIFVLENLRRPVGISTIAEQFDEKILASVLSIESQLSSVIGAVISLVIGLVADRFGPGLAIMFMALLILMLYPALRIIKNK